MSTLQVAAILSSTANTPPVIQDSTGAQIGQFAKAWVKFDGTVANPTVSGSFNVTSVTKNATGDYTINFTLPMSSANYAVAGCTSFGNTLLTTISQLAASCRINTYNNATSQNRDCTVFVAFF
jgi:hypothetical protein